MSWWDGVNDTRIIIAPDPNDRDGVGQLLSLRHPKSGNSSCYRLVDGGIQELQWFKQSYRSWFLGDYVCGDGCLYIASPIDPVFIFLPIFEEARMKKNNDPGKFRQLDEIIYVDGYPGYQHLLSIAEKSMQLVCEIKEIGSTKFFRLDDSKVLTWLFYKARKVKETLSVLDKNYAAQHEADAWAGAVSILGEYVKEDKPWLALLCNYLKIKTPGAAMEAADMKVLSPSAESSLCPSNSVKGGGSGVRGGKQAKRAKLEVDSKNIKDMFSRASRKK